MNCIRNISARGSLSNIHSLENSPVSILKTPKSATSKDKKHVHFSTEERAIEPFTFRFPTPLVRGHGEKREGVSFNFQQQDFEIPKHRRSKSGVETIEQNKPRSQDVSFENPKHLSISSLINSFNRRKEILAQATQKQPRKNRRVNSDRIAGVAEVPPSKLNMRKRKDSIEVNKQNMRLKKSKPPTHNKR